MPFIVDATVDDLTPLRPAAPPLRCQDCGDVIGVYEPLVRLRENGPHTTSIAAEPELLITSEGCYHGGCYELDSAGRAADPARERSVLRRAS